MIDEQTTLADLSKYDGLIVVEGTGDGNVRFKGHLGRKTKPMYIHKDIHKDNELG